MRRRRKVLSPFRWLEFEEHHIVVFGDWPEFVVDCRGWWNTPLSDIYVPGPLPQTKMVALCAAGLINHVELWHLMGGGHAAR